MSILFSVSLFYLSFIPLWISVSFIDIKSIIENTYGCCTEIISLACIIIGAIISCIIAYRELSIKNNSGTSKYEIINVQEEKTITAEFLLSYILPLFAFDFTKWDEVVLFLIFFFALAYLCIKHKYFSVNIALEIVGYRFYNCDLLNEDNVKITLLIISHWQLNDRLGENITLKPINNEYQLAIQAVDKT